MLYKRLFIAFPPTPDVTVSVRKMSRSLRLSIPVKWTPEANLHLTAVFIGRAPEAAIDGIVSSMSSTVQRIRPFTLRFDEVAWAPPGTSASMIWFRFKSNATFEVLVRELQASLVSVDCARIKRPSSIIPHITVARFKKTPVRHGPLEFDSDLGIFPCRELVLYESVSTSEGPRYDPLARTAFPGYNGTDE